MSFRLALKTEKMVKFLSLEQKHHSVESIKFRPQPSRFQKIFPRINPGPLPAYRGEQWKGRMGIRDYRVPTFRDGNGEKGQGRG